MLTTILELIGFALIAIGAGMAWTPAGFIVGGALLVLVGYLTGGSQ